MHVTRSSGDCRPPDTRGPDLAAQDDPSGDRNATLSRDGGTPRSRVLIVGHSYCAPENRKNIEALTGSARVQVALPHVMFDTQAGSFEAVRIAPEDNKCRIYRRLGLSGSQYLLASWDLGMTTFAPDLIHVEYDPWSTIFWQLVRVRRRHAPAAALICTVKKNTYRRYPGLLGRAKDGMARAGIKHVDHFVTASRSVANLYRSRFHIPDAAISVVPFLGVDTDLFSPPLVKGRNSGSGPGKVCIGYCGRLDPHKGVQDLFEATRRCRERTGVDIVLEYLGGGSLSTTFEQAARKYPWFRVHRPVPHRDVARFLQGLDAFVLPSRVLPDHEEHDAHALLEALAVGLPAIGTRSGIIPEVIEDAGGILVEPECEDGLADALQVVVADSTRRSAMGIVARAAALRLFSLAAVAGRKIAIYERLIRRRRRALGGSSPRMP
jgi:glycosyltransferase involved in cell wall biosynthesis